MKKINSIILVLALLFSSCESVVEGINDNPNKITPEDVEAELFLTGTMLANSVAQLGHTNRIAGMWTGQLIGFQSLYSNIYGYNISTAESASTWSRYYVGMIPHLRHIRTVRPDDDLLQGICKALEAHAIGTAASIFGDIPYSEINDPTISDPKFDSQASVFAAMQTLLDEAINDLASAGAGRNLPQDIYFEGDAAAWMEAAYTLKARYYLQTKEYNLAATAAQNGISSAAGNMQHIPRGDASIQTGDKNTFYMVLSGSRAGDIGTGNSYLIQLVDPGSAVSRSHAKTDETARLGYFSIDEGTASNNMGIANQFENENLVSYRENLLIRAEAEARAGGLAAGLPFLNEWRAYMRTGGHLNEAYDTVQFTYDDFAAADFANGGIENTDGIADDRAFLREVVEERYVSGFRTFMPFNDVRRLAKNDSDLIVPFPFNTGTATQQPQRLPYSSDEINTNANSPLDDPGIYVVTEVNQ